MKLWRLQYYCGLASFCEYTALAYWSLECSPSFFRNAIWNDQTDVVVPQGTFLGGVILRKWVLSFFLWFQCCAASVKWTVCPNPCHKHNIESKSIQHQSKLELGGLAGVRRMKLCSELGCWGCPCPLHAKFTSSASLWADVEIDLGTF